MIEKKTKLSDFWKRWMSWNDVERVDTNVSCDV
jgi:hypothetical protein